MDCDLPNLYLSVGVNYPNGCPFPLEKPRVGWDRDQASVALESQAHFGIGAGQQFSGFVRNLQFG